MSFFSQTLQNDRSPSIASSLELARPDDLDSWFQNHGFLVEKSGLRETACWRKISKDGKSWTVAYKTDWRMTGTGKLFIEEFATMTKWRKTKGWAIDDRFSTFVFYSPQDQSFWWIPATTVRTVLASWKRTHTPFYVQNHGYVTVGYSIPPLQFAGHAKFLSLHE